MKILYHHRTASADGQAVHIGELIGALRARGHEVRVVGPATSSANVHGATNETRHARCPHPNPLPEGEGTNERLREFHVNDMGKQLNWVPRLKALLPQSLYELLELAYSLLAYRRLAQAVREFHPDVLYERYNLYMLAGVMIRRRYRLPLLLEVNSPLAEERLRHDGLGMPQLARWSEKTVWRAADYVLPVTQVLADVVAASGVAQEKIRVLPNGINKAHFLAAPDHATAKSTLGLTGCVVLGFTGFVRDWHGVDKILRWMAGRTDALHLLVVGDGPVREALEQQARDLGIAERVTFTGVVPRDQVPALVAAFDIALQPAVVPYASPLKLFEYLAMGCAIVAPDTPNLREVLQDGRNALLFAPDQAGALEGALDRLCGDQVLRARLGVAARATIDECELTWLDNARKIEALVPLACRRAEP